MSEEIKASKEQHLATTWKIHEIANDFELWDVWNIPIKGNNSEKENFAVFYEIAIKTFVNPSSRQPLPENLLAQGMTWARLRSKRSTVKAVSMCTPGC